MRIVRLVLALAILAMPLAAIAQQPGKVVRIGWINDQELVWTLVNEATQWPASSFEEAWLVLAAQSRSLS